MRTIRLATRSSPLARFQAEQVASLLTRAGSERLAGKGSIGLLEVELVLIETTGDRRRDVSIGALGGQGVFVKEVEQALLDGRADVAVHSAKDLPSSYADDALAIVAVPGRADARDALVGRSLGELGPGARIATGAARRRAQLAWARPDLRFEELRGNIATRLGKVPPGGAVVVALAALQRLGLIELAAEVLPVSIVLPQAGQGALAVQCRVDDDETVVAVRLIDDERAHRCVDAERAFLRELGGGCDLPVGAHATGPAPDGTIALEGLVAAADGTVVLRRRAVGSEPGPLGADLARELLDRCGGTELLAGAYPRA